MSILIARLYPIVILCQYNVIINCIMSYRSSDTIGQIFHNPEAQPSVTDVVYPVLGQATLHFMPTLDHSAKVLNPHMGALSASDVLLLNLSVLPGSLADSTGALQVKHPKFDTMPQSERAAKAAYAAEKMLEKRKRQILQMERRNGAPPPPKDVQFHSDLDKALLRALWSRPYIQVERVDLDVADEDDLEIAIKLYSHSKINTPLTHRAEPFEAITEIEEERFTDYANVVRQRDEIIAKKTAEIAETRAKRNLPNGLFLPLSLEQAGVVYTLRDWGLPPANIAPYDALTTEEVLREDKDTPHEDPAVASSTRSRDMIALWDIVPDPTTALLLKRRAQLAPTEKDLAMHVANMIIGEQVLTELASENPHAPKHSLLKLISLVMNQFDPGEVQTLYDAHRDQPKEVVSAAFYKRFTEHFRSLEK